MSVLINNFEILASSSSEIIIKSSWSSSLGSPIFIVVVGSRLLNESNSTKNSSVFGAIFGTISDRVG